MTYVMSGGLGGLGKTFSKWMVGHGAKHIAFLSRSGASKPEAKEILENLTKQGIDARAFKCDIGNPENVKQTVAELQKEMPPIKGLIQAAMSLSVSQISTVNESNPNFSAGLCFPQHDPRRLGSQCQPQGPRHMESSRILAKGLGLLRDAFLQFRCHWYPRSS